MRFQLAPSAFLASAAGATGAPVPATPNKAPQQPRHPAAALAEAAWRVLGGSVCPVTGEVHIQRKWDKGICELPVADNLSAIRN